MSSTQEFLTPTANNTTPTAKLLSCSKLPANRTSHSVDQPPVSRCPSCQGVRQGCWPDSRESGAWTVTWRTALPATRIGLPERSADTRGRSGPGGPGVRAR
jgi:hypothetical protein